jgi:uncharacterized protein (DUF1778 family)
MARPRKEKRLLMSAQVRIPLTEEQKRLIEQAASLEHSDLTAWMRPILLQAATKRIAQGRGAAADSPFPTQPEQES